MDISEKLCHLETALPSVSSDIVVFCTHGTGGSSEEQYECWAAGWSVCFAAFPDPRVQVRLATMLNDLQHQKLTGLMQEWLTRVDGKVWSFKQREFIC